MATDYAKLVSNVLEFYNFRGKAVLSIGAGGGQLVEYGRPAARVIAVDNSDEALGRLRASLAASGLSGKFTLVLSDFDRCENKGDVAVFEFCLHEMPDPAQAVEHARKLAGDVLVLDHCPGSEWAYYVSEEKKVARSWQALQAFHFRKEQKYEAVQFFKDYEELYQKVRIKPFIGRENFSIPMTYGFAML
jgi:SAM-dependent methyltransferase